MKSLKITSFLTLILYIVGLLFLIFRTSDGAGIQNSLSIGIISVIIWSILFVFIFVILLVLYIILKKRDVK